MAQHNLHYHALIDQEEMIELKEIKKDQSPGDDRTLLLQDSNEDEELNKPPDDEPVPWAIIFVGSFANATESFTANILYPFVEDYCGEWLSVEERNKAMWAGFLVGIFNIGLAISNPFLGAFSDRYGRKSIFLGGMFISGACTFVLGFTKSLYWALFFRFVGGFANANLAISKALVSDLTRLQKNRSLAFVYFAGAFACFRCLATFAAGVTVHQTFGLWDDFPYLLPFLITFILNLLCCFSVWWIVPSNTHKLDPANDQPILVDISSRILSGMKELVSTRLLQKLTTAMVVNHFCSGYLLLVLAMYAEMDRSDHGYGLSIAETSYLIAIFGLSGFVFQVFGAKRVTELLPPRNRYIIFNWILCICVFLYPMLSFIYWNDAPSDPSLPDPPVNSTFVNNTTSDTDIQLSSKQEITFWVLVSILSVFGGMAYLFVMPTLSALQSMVISPENFGNCIGTMTGVGQLARGVAPFIAGVLITLGKMWNFPFLSWFLCLAGYLFCSFLLMFMTPGEKEILARDSQVPKKVVQEHERKQESPA